jgi:hypothetical protein
LDEGEGTTACEGKVAAVAEPEDTVSLFEVQAMISAA